MSSKRIEEPPQVDSKPPESRVEAGQDEHDEVAHGLLAGAGADGDYEHPQGEEARTDEADKNVNLDESGELAEDLARRKGNKGTNGVGEGQVDEEALV